MDESDIEEVKALVDNIDKLQDQLRKDVVHVLRGVDPGKISTKKFDSAVSVAKRVSDGIDKDVKKLRKLVK